MIEMRDLSFPVIVFYKGYQIFPTYSFESITDINYATWKEKLHER